MPAKSSDWAWLDAQASVDQAELSRMSGMSTADIEELVHYGALVPLGSGTGQCRRFLASTAGPLREAARMRADFDLDLFTVGIMLRFLQRIGQLEHQLRAMHGRPHPQQLPREGPTPWREPHA